MVIYNLIYNDLKGSKQTDKKGAVHKLCCLKIRDFDPLGPLPPLCRFFTE